MCLGLRLTLERAQYCKLEEDAWCSMRGKMKRRREKEFSAKKRQTIPEAPVTLIEGGGQFALAQFLSQEAIRRGQARVQWLSYEGTVELLTR
jgi:hypothetical protein